MTRFAFARAESFPLNQSSPLAELAGRFVRRLRAKRGGKPHPRPDRMPDYILRDIGLSRVEFEFGTGGRILDVSDSSLFRN